MAYRFDITHKNDGTVRVSCGEFTHHNERGLARKLVEAGAEDGEIQAGRDGRVDWTVASLHRFAAATLNEGEKGFSVGVYAPYPVRDLHPNLDRAISALALDRKTASEERAAKVVAAKAQKALAASHVGMRERDVG